VKAPRDVHDRMRREIEKTIALVEHAPRGHDAKVEAVHDVRKRFKKVRAALRLLREAIGDDAYHDTNLAFRDAARPLTRVRDAQMLVPTLDALVGEDTSVDTIRSVLRAAEEETSRRVLRDARAFAVVRDFAKSALARETTRAFEGDGLAVAHGLRRVYRDARRAFARASETPSVETLHEWRKQTKYLWHALRFDDAPEQVTNAAHELSRVLGDDHDLAVLKQTLAADPTAFGGHRALKPLFARVDDKRSALEQQAFTLGRQLFAAPPAVFGARVEQVASDSP